MDFREMGKYIKEITDAGIEALRIAADTHYATCCELIKPIYRKEKQESD